MDKYMRVYTTQSTTTTTYTNTYRERSKHNLGYFTKSDNDIMKEIVKKCGLRCYGTYMVILSCRNAQTGECFPSYSYIAETLNTSVSTVTRYIKKLYEEGFILINSGRQGINNNYFFIKEDFYNGEGVMATKKKKTIVAKKGT